MMNHSLSGRTETSNLTAARSKMIIVIYYSFTLFPQGSYSHDQEKLLYQNLRLWKILKETMEQQVREIVNKI